VASLFLCGSSHAREHFGQGLAVDIEVPYEKAVKAVQQVAENGSIQGTSQFRGTSGLEGATVAQKAPGFKDWQGKGTIFYKVRPDTIAPEHFEASGDKGTVAVRYVVEAGGPTLTHVRIDAVYSEDDGHRSHASDGQVENSEFAVISKQIDDMNEAEVKGKEQEVQKQQEQQLESLQLQLDQENAALRAAITRQAQLEKEVRELRGVRSALVRKASTELKAEPRSQAETLGQLAEGEGVTVLRQTASWYRVQTATGQQGWIYHLLLDVAP